MNLFSLIFSANRHLFENKARSLLTILAIFVGSFAIILNSAISAGVNDFIDKQVSSIGGDGFIMVMPSSMYDQVASSTNSSTVREYTGSASGVSAMSSANISEADLESMKAVDGVKSLEIFHMLSAEWLARADENEVSENTKYEVEIEYYPLSSMQFDLSAGRLTDDSDDASYEILISEDWLEPLGFASAEDALDQKVQIAFNQTALCSTSTDCLKYATATIVGVQTPGILTSSGELHINKSLDNYIYDVSTEGLPDSMKTNAFAVGEADPEKIADIRSAFEEIGDGYSFITVDDTVGLIRSFLNAILLVLNIFGAIALVAAAIGIVNTLLMSVEERTREIGLEKALGLSKLKIFLSFSFEAIFLGFWGSVVGIFVAVLLGNLANSALHEPGAILANFPTFSLVKFSPDIIAPIVLLIMFIAFLAGTIPALRAAKKSPIDALRYE